MNILVICADTFRADYLGCDGNSWIQTPHIDKLASEGIRFDEFYGEALPTIVESKPTMLVNAHTSTSGLGM